MSILGRGLASLIPKRDIEDAEEALERIDSMEEIGDEPATEAPPAAPVEAEPVAPTDTPAVPTAKKTLNVLEELEDLDDMEGQPLPPKPNVTPLTIDPETGAVRAVTTAEAAKVVEGGVATVTVSKMAAASVDTSQPAAKVRKKKTVAAKAVRKKAAIIKPLKQELEAEPEQAGKAKPQRPAQSAATTGETVPARPAAAPTDADIDAALWDRHEEKVQLIPLGDIKVNPLQPRRTFDPEEMEELTHSIEQHGILQPLVVIRDSKGYELVAGERRLRAAKSLGWEKVPAVVKMYVTSQGNRLELALIENIQRENLNPIEEALGYKRLNDEFGLTHEEIGNRVSKSRVNITNTMRVLQLPAEIQRGLIEGKITLGHARAILMIPDEEKQLRFYQHMLDEGLTVRKAEMRARRIQHQMKVTDPLRQKKRGRPQLALKYEHAMENKYGYTARVKFNENKNRFEVLFYAFSEKEAEELIGRLLDSKFQAAYPEDEESDEEE